MFSRRAYPRPVTGAALLALVVACLLAGCTPRVDAEFHGRLLDLEDRRVGDTDTWRQLYDRAPDDPARARVVRAVGRLRDERLSLLLAEWWQDANSTTIRAEILFALGQSGSDASRAILRAALGDSRPALRALAAEALGKLGQDADVPPLTTLIDDAEAEVRGAALLAVTRLRGRRAATDTALSPTTAAALADAIRRRLDDIEREVRWRAAYALADIETDGRLPLLEETAHAADRRARLFAVRAVSRLEGDDDRRRTLLADVLDYDSDVHVAAAAADGLGGLADPGNLSVLLRGAGRTGFPWDHHVRRASFTALGQLSTPADPADVERLQAALRRGLDDTAHGVRAAALDTLAVHFPRQALPLVNRQAASTDRLARQSAARTAARLPEDQAAPLLTRLNGDPEPLVVTAALETLAGRETSGEAARQAARSALERDDLAIRGTAMSVLERTGTLTDVPAIAAAYRASRGSDWIEVRVAAVQAVASLAVLSTEAGDESSSDVATEETDESSSDSTTDDAGETTGPETTPPGAEAFLRQALNDPAPAVRRLAAEALAIETAGAGTSDLDDSSPSTVSVVPGEDWLSGRPNPVVQLDTSRGTVNIELLRDEAPRHVKSFLANMRGGLYDGLPFHRVVSGFVVQGLDPRGDGWGSGGVALRDEINPVRYTTGVLGMPNAGPDSGGCQIFITHVPTPNLDGGYTVFGRVIDGMAVVDALDVGDIVTEVNILR